MKLALILILALASVARADDDAPEQVRMTFVERGDNITVSTKLTKLFDNSTYAALDSGFLSTVVIRFWVYPKDSNDPVAFVLVERSVLYEVWDEDYVLRLDEPSGSKKIKVKYRAEALKWLTSIDDLPIARLADIPRDGSLFMLAMEVELNPVSKETLAEVRRWLSQGTGGGLDRGGAFFGSFVSVFVNPKIAAADRVLRIRSQPFFRPKP